MIEKKQAVLTCRGMACGDVPQVSLTTSTVTSEGCWSFIIVISPCSCFLIG